MRNGGGVPYHVHLQPCGLERPDGGLAARAGALHDHVDFLDAVFLDRLGDLGRGDLGGEGVDFLVPLKPTFPPEAHARMLPPLSLTQTMVLLNVE